MDPRFVVPEDGSINFVLTSSTTGTVFAQVSHLIYGERQRPKEITLVHSSGDRTPQNFSLEMPEGGEIVGLLVTALGKRGQQFVAAFLRHRELIVHRLLRGYAYVGGDLSLGQDDEMLSRQGFLNWVQEANDVAGNVATTVNLGLTNARRMIRAIIVKYHQVGGADATITMTLRDLADSGGPTNWSIVSDTWVSPSLVLAANQEGLIHVGEHGFVSTNDAGTIAYADNTTAPNPFPFMVEEGETADLIIAAAAGASGDDYDVWVQYEEWLEI